MKRYIYIGLFLLATVPMIAQNNMAAYEFWFDGDYANATTQTLAPNQNIDLITSINANALSNGPHLFYVRFLDQAGQWSSPVSQFIFKIGLTQTTTNHVVAAEFWFDSDYANATKQSISPTQNYALLTNVNANALSNGPHLFYVRFLDEAGRWSSPVSHFIFKAGNTSTSTNKVVAYEFWFDSDYANATHQNITASQNFELLANVNANALSNGPHIFYVRFLDEAGRWSAPVSHFVFKGGLLPTGTNKIVAYEHWFDSDYANAIHQSISASQNFELITSIDANALRSGPHLFYIRFLDEAGRWSSPISHFIFKAKQVPAGNNLVNQYRYWFDGDFSTVVHKTLSNPQTAVFINSAESMLHLWKGQHTVHLQFLDSRGQWSTIISDTVTKVSLPIADFDFITTGNCDSTQVSFTDLSIDGDSFMWDFGNGQTSTNASAAATYFTPGQYVVSFTITDTLTMVSSTKTDTLFVTGKTTASIADTACGSYTSPSGLYVYAQSGIYSDTIANQWNCDSIISLNIKIYEEFDSTYAATACESYTAPWGAIYTASGNYSSILTSTMGCDSTLNLQLTIYNGSDTAYTVDACREYIAPWGISYFVSGVYTDTIQTTMGCDSAISITANIVNIDTSVAKSPTTLSAIQAAASYQWLDCNNNFIPITGATNQVFTAVQNGLYAVEISFNGCVDTSACQAITQISIVEDAFAKLRVYPNPTHGNLVLDFGELQTDIEISITSIDGRILSKLNATQQREVTLEINEPPGVYVLIIRINNSLYRTRIVKL